MRATTSKKRAKPIHPQVSSNEAPSHAARSNLAQRNVEGIRPLHAFRRNSPPSNRQPMDGSGTSTTAYIHRNALGHPPQPIGPWPA